MNYVLHFKDKTLDCVDVYNEKEIVKMCIKGMMDEYHIHIENHPITNFVELLTKKQNSYAPCGQRQYS